MKLFNIRMVLLLFMATAVTLTACNEATPTAVPNIALPTATAVPANPLPGYTVVVQTPAVALAYPSDTHTVVIPQSPNTAAYPGPEATSSAPLYTYRLINQYPHDPEAFTQGLVAQAGEFYEGTGRYGQSSLRRVNLGTGEVQQMISLPEQYFGEGIVLWEDRIIQLTWKEQTAFVYNRETFEKVGEFSYDTEGWGITHDGRRLIMSDGSNTLYFRDPETFAELGRVQVFDGEVPVARLNELEYIETGDWRGEVLPGQVLRGEVWANIWQTDRIARIDPETGQVTGWIDLSGLLNGVEITQPVDVLNGIAYDPKSGLIFVTGKLWPTLFEIEVIPVIE